MSDLISVTVLPKSGVMYSGSMFNEDAGEFYSGIGNEYLASLEAYDVRKPAFSAGTEKDNVKALEAALKPTYGYRITDVKPEIFEAQKLKLKMNHVKKQLMGSFNANAMKEMSNLQNQYNAVVNGLNTNQVTIVQFVQRLQAN